jgi:hypothetical protein
MHWGGGGGAGEVRGLGLWGTKPRKCSLGGQASIILVLRWWKQEDCEFEAYLSYLKKPCLKKKIDTPPPLFLFLGAGGRIQAFAAQAPCH